MTTGILFHSKKLHKGAPPLGSVRCVGRAVSLLFSFFKKKKEAKKKNFCPQGSALLLGYLWEMHFPKDSP